MAKYGVAAMVVQLAASLWALRDQGTLAERLAAANGIAWIGPDARDGAGGPRVGVLPAAVRRACPARSWLVLIPAVEVAVACAAVDVALTLVVEVIVFAARAWQHER